MTIADQLQIKNDALEIRNEKLTARVHQLETVTRQTIAGCGGKEPCKCCRGFMSALAPTVKKNG